MVAGVLCGQQHCRGPELPTAASRSLRQGFEVCRSAGSYGHPPAVYTGVDDTHKAHSPAEFNPPPTHLPTGSAVNVHARPMSPTDDGTGEPCVLLHGRVESHWECSCALPHRRLAAMDC